MTQPEIERFARMIKHGDALFYGLDIYIRTGEWVSIGHLDQARLRVEFQRIKDDPHP